MKLLNEKIDRMHFVRLGYDSYSESYIAHQTDGANDWYYKISEELYYIFDKDRGKYLEQIEKILELREKSEQFYFSYIHNSNVYSELNELYFWRDACLGKEKNEIYVKIGTPDKHIQLIFENEVCTEVRRICILGGNDHEENTNIVAMSFTYGLNHGLWYTVNKAD